MSSEGRMGAGDSRAVRPDDGSHPNLEVGPQQMVFAHVHVANLGLVQFVGELPPCRDGDLPQEKAHSYSVL